VLLLRTPPISEDAGGLMAEFKMASDRQTHIILIKGDDDYAGGK
jgi:hypothetical protein